MRGKFEKSKSILAKGLVAQRQISFAASYTSVVLSAVQTKQPGQCLPLSALTIRDFVPRLELLSPFRDFQKSMKMCEMNYFSLFCK